MVVGSPSDTRDVHVDVGPGAVAGAGARTAGGPGEGGVAERKKGGWSVVRWMSGRAR